jgi:hypothetical protein
MSDYQHFTTKNTPKSKRARLDVGDIWINAVRCTKCGDVIRSKNRHDFVTCKCNSISVDGGSWYAKRVGDMNCYEELSESFADVEKNP